MAGIRKLVMHKPNIMTPCFNMVLYFCVGVIQTYIDQYGGHAFGPKYITYIYIHSKGQLITKCLFGVFNFSQKKNGNKST